jgi:hypothetical protein
MSTISASTLTTTALQLTADTTGALVFKTGATPTTALTLGADQSATFAGTVNFGTAGFTSLSISGNLTFTTTGNRVLGDFSNAAQNNRVAFQTSTTNGNTFVAAIPNGTGTTSQLQVVNSSDVTNASLGVLEVTSSAVSIYSLIRGTGTYVPILFSTGGSERLRIDTSGNVGIGTTTTTNFRLNIVAAASNSYASYDAPTTGYAYSSYKFNGSQIGAVGQGSAIITGGGASNFGMTANADLVFGSNGITERMRIDSSGNVGIGTTPVTGTTTALLQVGGGILIPGNNLGLATNLYYASVGGWKYSTNGSGGYILMSRSSTVGIEFGYATNNTSGAGAAASPVVAMSINTNGAISLQGAVTTASGVGITFPATQSASSNANTLDDYEEGSWTPTLTFNGGSTGITYSTRTGKYVKIGRFVQAQFRITLSNKGSSTGSAKVEGLPFPVRDEYGGACFGYVGAMNNSTAVNTQNQTPTLDINNSYVFLRYMNNGSSADHTEASFNNNTDIIMNVTYIGDV